jgi:hypothetical protein
MGKARWKANHYGNCVPFEQLLIEYQAAKAAGLMLNFATGDRLLPDSELLDDSRHQMFFRRFLKECNQQRITP